MALEPGQQAPDFELKDQTGQPVRLSDYHGKKVVVLLFHPFAFMGTCETELSSIRDDMETFDNDDVVTLAVSVDSPFVHKHWAAEQGFDFPYLSDFWPHGEVSRAYGVFNDAVGAAERATFVIDKDGRITFAVHNAISDRRDASEYVAALKEIGAV